MESYLVHVTLLHKERAGVIALQLVDSDSFAVLKPPIFEVVYGENVRRGWGYPNVLRNFPVDEYWGANLYHASETSLPGFPQGVFLKSAGKLHPAHSSLMNLKAAAIKEVARLRFRKEL